MFFISILIYILTSLFTGLVLMGLSLKILTPEEIVFYLDKTVFADPSLQIVIGWTGALIVLSCVALIGRFTKGLRREKGITIQTAEGNLIINLSAIEDMIKKTVGEQKEISHIKPKVNITRKGINILIKGHLETEVNLVEFTSVLQSEIKKKIEYIFGGEKDVKVNLEIKKLAFSTRREVVEAEPEVPFRKY